MKKLLAYLVIFSIVVPVPTNVAQASEADCASTYKVSVVKPYEADDATKTINQRCKVTGKESSCASTYKFMWERYGSYGTESAKLCSATVNHTTSEDGGAALRGDAKAIAENARDGLAKIREEQDKDIKKLNQLRDENFSKAESAVANSDDASKETIKKWVKSLKERKFLEESDREKFRETVKKWEPVAASKPAADKAKEEINAAIDSLRFSTSVAQDMNGRAGAERTLGSAAETNNKNREKDGSGMNFGMSDAIGLLTLGAAGLGVMAAMKGSSASSGSSGLDTPTTPAAASTVADTAPATTTLPSSELGGSSGGAGTSTSSEPSFTAAPSTGQSVASFENGTANPTAITPTAASSAPGTQEPVLSQFSGALGGTPFSGSSTSSGGGAGAASAGSSDGRSVASEGGSAGGSHGSASDGALPGNSGSVPGYAGGSSAFAGGGGTEASLKEMFKGGDPFAMPALGAGAAGTLPDLGIGAPGADGALGAAGSAPGDIQSDAIPGADDARTLFARVKDFHRRSVKRGLVTSEAGGKI